jgi:hypothetical protein
MSSEAGKGSTQRPRSIADEEWANRWDAIFAKDESEQTKKDIDDGLHLGLGDLPKHLQLQRDQ